METQFRESFTKDLRKIRDKSLLKRVEGIIETVEQARRLEEVPSIGKMPGWKRYYRIEVGDYRIGVAVDSNVVTFIRFLHRKDIYRDFP
ncbi:MAG: plasmid stabilization protein [Chloroflexi bacterium HGW-Chloroflexi-1]|nr:MAG: plasmid stabilization protein [Chloroflexi bacterium HGW-Chloroflexi-1]